MTHATTIPGTGFMRLSDINAAALAIRRFADVLATTAAMGVQPTPEARRHMRQAVAAIGLAIGLVQAASVTGSGTSVSARAGRDPLAIRPVPARCIRPAGYDEAEASLSARIILESAAEAHIGETS